MHIQEAYRMGGFDNCILPALNTQTFLEDITGLTAMKAEMDSIADHSWYDSEDTGSDL